MNEQNTINNSQRNIFWNNYSLTITVLTAIGIGLIVPINGVVSDVLLIFGISLTAAITIIALFAKTNSEAGGFASMVLSATVIQLAASAAAIKQLSSGGNTGIILSSAGKLMDAEGYQQVIACCVMAVVGGIVIYSIVKVHRSLKAGCRELVEYVAPLRKIGIEGMAQTGYVSAKYAKMLLQRIENEKAFHITTSKSVLFVLMSIIAQIGLFCAGYAFTADSEMFISTIVCAGAILFLSSLVSGLSCQHLAKKNAPLEIQSHTNVDENVHQQTETVEASNDNTNAGDPIIIDDTVTAVSTVGKTEVIESNFETAYKFWKWNAQTSTQAVELISSGKANGDKVFLMASESISSLPVTAAVNTAMKITKKGFKCLLADFDFVHNSASKVFGATAAKGTINAKTGIANLHIWSAGDSSVNNISAFKNTMDNFADRYDVVLIYAPAIKGTATKQQIASCVDSAMLFGDDEESDTAAMQKFAETLQSEKTKMLEPNQTSDKLIVR